MNWMNGLMLIVAVFGGLAAFMAAMIGVYAIANEASMGNYWPAVAAAALFALALFFFGAAI